MEVAPSTDPVALPRDSEGMQVYQDKHVAMGWAKTHAVRPEYTTKNERRLCGLRPTTLWLFTALIIALAGLVAVAGGLGNRLKDAEDRAERSTLTPSNTTTITLASTATVTAGAASTTTGGLLLDYAAPAATKVATVSLDCPNVDKTNYTTGHNQTFALSCFAGLTGADYSAIVAYSYEDCIEACSSYNYWTSNATACSGLQFTDRMAGTYADYFGNCWLKHADYELKLGVNGGLSATIVA